MGLIPLWQERQYFSGAGKLSCAETEDIIPEKLIIRDKRNDLGMTINLES